jgi:hypothetical protein
MRLLLLCLTLALPVFGQVLDIPHGKPAIIDGKISPAEWDDAASFVFRLSGDREVPVLYKHDGANLYFAFQQLGKDDKLVFPELLIDPKNSKSDKWQPGQWWLHASANDCEGNGAFNVYNVDGKFMCSKLKSGWWANNVPLTSEQTIEIKVSFAKLNLAPDKKRFGIALDLTNTRELWVFWPSSAKLETPRTWGEAVLKD